jgi:hypothetical protein
VGLLAVGWPPSLPSGRPLGLDVVRPVVADPRDPAPPRVPRIRRSAGSFVLGWTGKHRRTLGGIALGAHGLGDDVEGPLLMGVMSEECCDFFLD